MEELIPPLPAEILSKIIHFGNRNRSIPLVCQQFRQLSEYEYIPNGRDLLQAIKIENVDMCNRIARSRKFDFDFDQGLLDYCIIEASNYGYLQIVELLLTHGADPSNTYNDALRWASRKGHLAVVERLLQDRRVDPRDVNNYAIRKASEYGHLAVVERLLQDRRVDPSVNDNEALRLANRNGHLAVVERLAR